MGLENTGTYRTGATPARSEATVALEMAAPGSFEATVALEMTLAITFQEVVRRSCAL